MKRSLIFFIILVILILGALGYRLRLQNLFLKEERPMTEKVLENKKIALIIAFRDFRDEEYFIPRNILKKAGAEVLTLSSQKGTAIGAEGGEAKVDLEVSEFRAESFDAIVFIGGPGMAKKLDDGDFQRIAQEAQEAGKLVGAICIAPALLAKAGLLSDKKATVWSSPLDKSPIKILEEGGAEYLEEKVVIDNKVITANGPAAAEEFGQAIIEALK